MCCGASNAAASEMDFTSLLGSAPQQPGGSWALSAAYFGIFLGVGDVTCGGGPPAGLGNHSAEWGAKE